MSNSTILNILADIGRLLLIGGAESFRIEDTVERVGQELGVQVNCYVTLTAVFVSEKMGTNTKIVKTKPAGFNLQTVDEINTLSRRLTGKEISSIDFVREFNHIKYHVIDYPVYCKLISAGLVSMAPMLISKSNCLDYILMFITGLIGYGLYYVTSYRSQTPYISEFIGGFTIGLITYFFTNFNVEVNTTNIVLGAMMPLVPGLAITNSLREIIMGDVISGLVRSVNAMLVLASLACGVWAALECVNFM